MEMSMKLIIHILKLWWPIAIAEVLIALYFLPEGLLTGNSKEPWFDYLKLWPLIYIPAIIVDYQNHNKISLFLIETFAITILSYFGVFLIIVLFAHYFGQFL